MIGEALALTRPYRCNGAVIIAVPKRGTMVIAEIKFRQIAMQVFLAAMLINALHSALKDAEKALNGIG